MRWLMFLMMMSVTFGSSFGFAQVSGAELRKASNAIHNQIDRNADLLSDREREQVMQQLRTIRQILKGRGDNEPGDPGTPGGYASSTVVGPLSRRGGGQLHALRLSEPLELTEVEVRSLTGKIKLYEANLVLTNGSRLPLTGITSVGVLLRDQTASSGRLPGRAVVDTIEFRVEAWGDNFDMEVMARSPQRPPRFDDEQSVADGSYCTAACANSSGSPDLAFSAGASARFELEAKDAARAAVRSKFSCSYGIVDSECSPVRPGLSYTCSASCRRSDGSPDLAFAAGGEANSLSGAKDAARQNVRKKWSCSYSVTDVSCSNGENDPHYCVAACALSNGQADLNYSQGARGNNRVDAELNAIEAVRKKWSCSYGMVIQQCSR